MATPPAPAPAAGRRIVVAVDEGDESMHALSWCLANVVSSSSSADTVVLLHARRPRPVYAAMDSAGTHVVVRAPSASRLVTNDHNLLFALASCRVHAYLGRDGQRGAARRRRLVCGRRQGQAPLRRSPACERGDAGGERGPARRDLRRHREDRCQPARHGQPWIRLHPKGVPRKRQQPLRPELQMPRSDCQEAQGAIPVT